MNIRQLEETSPKMNLNLRLSLQETRLLRSLSQAEGLSVTGYLKHLLRRAGVAKVSLIAQEARRA